MTGEMSKAEVTRESFPLHFAIADALQGDVHPFDQYQGPFIQTRYGRLWLVSDESGSMCHIYNERTRAESGGFFPDATDAESNAVECAREVTAP